MLRNFIALLLTLSFSFHGFAVNSASSSKLSFKDSTNYYEIVKKPELEIFEIHLCDQGAKCETVYQGKMQKDEESGEWMFLGLGGMIGTTLGTAAATGLLYIMAMGLGGHSIPVVAPLIQFLMGLGVGTFLSIGIVSVATGLVVTLIIAGVIYGVYMLTEDELAGAPDELSEKMGSFSKTMTELLDGENVRLDSYEAFSNTLNEVIQSEQKQLVKP